MTDLEVLLEDNHVLAVNKRAGLATMGVAAGTPSLIEEAKQYLKDRYDKPGNVYVGVVSRLDAPVTGVVLLAKTSKAAGRLCEAFRLRSVDKRYLALVVGAPPSSAGALVHHLRKDERHKRMHVVGAPTPDSQSAELRYRVEATNEHATLLEVELLTGRKHQIRVQLAAIGCPILGDRKYGGPVTFPEGIALHARRVVFEHPVRREAVEVTAPLPKAWKGELHRLGVRWPTG